MATGKRYYWIKLKESFMTSDTVDFLMSQKDGANYVVLYQMLCLKTINTGGRLARQIGEIIIPYDVEKIQRDCKWFTADTIRVALELFAKFGLVYQDEDGTLVLADHYELVGSETNWKKIKAAQRAKNLPKLKGCRRLNSSMLRLPTGKTQYVDENRYGGNGMKAFDLAGGKCEMCGSYIDLLIHHANGYSNIQEDLYVLCKTCHGTAHSPSTPGDWLRHAWVNHEKEGGQEGGPDGGQGGGQVHPDIRDKRLEIRDKRLDTRVSNAVGAELFDKSSCPEAKPAVFTLPLNNGTQHEVTQDDIDGYSELYPAVDVPQEIRKMIGWLDANPKKRKTKRGVKNFINGWLSREQDRGGKSKQQLPRGQPPPPVYADEEDFY